MDLRVAKPKTQRGKRFLREREAKIDEHVKRAMLIKGGKTSEMVTQALKDIHALKKPNSIMLQRKNILRPFEDQTSLEFFCQKNNTSLMVFGSHSKKRPNNLVFGSFYNGHILDMIELGIEKYTPVEKFKTGKIASGTKPCLVFIGEEFENNMEYKRIKTLFTDFWRGEKVTNVRLQGLEHVIQVAVVGNKIFFRSYKILMKKSGEKTPRVELQEIGPSFDFVVRRTHLAAESLYKETLRQPKALKVRKVKNIERDVLGTKLGRIHMQKQDLDSIQLRKMKGLKRTSKMTSSAEKDGHKKRKENTASS